MFPRTLTGRIISRKNISFRGKSSFYRIMIIIIIIIIIIITQHKSCTTCPISEFVFRFYIYYTELSRIANGDLLDLYFITQQQGIFEHL